MSVVTITLKGVDEASSVIEGTAGALGGLGEMAGGLLTAGLGVAAAGVTGLTAVLGFSFSAALENEQAQSSLAQVIKATGGAAGVTAEEANEMATQFADLAGGSDDAIIAIETIGLRAGTVAEEDFPRFIQASLDLGTVMGSTEAAATLLARAGDDIGAAIGKAEKAGILFTDEQKAQMIAMQDAGDTAGALDLFMQQLANTTGGAAAANAETLTGKWELMKGKFGEAAETIGMSLLPMATQLFDNVLAPAIPLVTSLAEQFGYFFTSLLGGDSTGAFETLYEAFDILSVAFPGLSEQINIAQAAFANLPATFETVRIAIQPVIDASMNLANAFIASMPMIMASVQSMVDFVINLFNTFSPTIIANVSSTLNNIAEFWTAHGSQIMAIVSFAFETITATVGGAITLVTGIIAAGLEYINTGFAIWSAIFAGDWQGAFDAFVTGTSSMHAIITSTWEAFMNGVLSIVDTDLSTFTATWTDVWNMAGVLVNTAWNNIKLAIANAGLSVVSGVQGIVGNIGAAFFNFLPTMSALGGAIIDNVAAGISGAVGNLVGAAQAAAQSAYQAILDALGMHSPSPMLQEIGMQLNTDVARGVEMTTPLLGRATALSAESMARPVIGAGQAASNSSRSPSSTNVTLNINISGSARSMKSEIESAVNDALKSAGLVVNHTSRMGARA